MLLAADLAVVTADAVAVVAAAATVIAVEAGPRPSSSRDAAIQSAKQAGRQNPSCQRKMENGTHRPDKISNTEPTYGKTWNTEPTAPEKMEYTTHHPEKICNMEPTVAKNGQRNPQRCKIKHGTPHTDTKRKTREIDGTRRNMESTVRYRRRSSARTGTGGGDEAGEIKVGVKFNTSLVGLDRIQHYGSVGWVKVQVLQASRVNGFSK